MSQILICDMMNLQAIPALALWTLTHGTNMTIYIKPLLPHIVPLSASHIFLIKFCHLFLTFLFLKDVTIKTVCLQTLSTNMSTISKEFQIFFYIPIFIYILYFFYIHVDNVDIVETLYFQGFSCLQCVYKVRLHSIRFYVTVLFKWQFFHFFTVNCYKVQLVCRHFFESSLHSVICKSSRAF